MCIRVKVVKLKVRIGVFVLVCAALLAIAASQVVVSWDTEQSECSTCHTNQGVITVNTVTTVDTEPGATFSLNVQVDGTGGPSTLLVRFPTLVEDNDEFTYIGLDASGTVNDGDSADTNGAALQIEVDYSIVAPAIAGTYTLKVYGVGNNQHSQSALITVNAIPAGPGPLITNVNGTPDIPLEDETVLVKANVTSADTIVGVTLQYSTDNGTNWNNVTMTLVGGLYQGTIPVLPDGTYVVFRIVAVDDNGIWSVSGELSYRVGDIPLPPPPPPLQFHYGWYLGVPALILAYVGTALEYYDEERFTREHGIMLSLAYFLTLINVISLVTTSPGAWSALNPINLIQFDLARLTPFLHSWHIWLGIVSMIFGTLALVSHLAGWKTCNLGLPAVLLWTILGLTGMYFNVVGFVM